LDDGIDDREPPPPLPEKTPEAFLAPIPHPTKAQSPKLPSPGQWSSFFCFLTSVRGLQKLAYRIFSVSQGESSGNPLLAPACPIEMVTLWLDLAGDSKPMTNMIQ